MTSGPVSISGIIPANTGRILRALTTASAAAGSSPRIRGEFCVPPCQSHEQRIIPANTGRIRLGGCAQPRSWDHPREYGENLMKPKIGMRTLGSSPRIRGEFVSEFDEGGDCGIIPANTGRILNLMKMLKVSRDHPREYGEN